MLNMYFLNYIFEFKSAHLSNMNQSQLQIVKKELDKQNTSINHRIFYTYLTVVISWHFGHRTGELSHLKLLGEIPFQAGEQDFSLTGFKSVHHGGNGASVVHVGV